MLIDAIKGEKLLRNQIRLSKKLKTCTTSSPEWKTWYRDTEVAIEKTFGDKTRHLVDFRRIVFSSCRAYSVGRGISYSDYQDQKDLQKGLEDSRAILASMVNDLYIDESSNSTAGNLNTVILDRVFTHFHLIAKHLALRCRKQEGLLIKNEYDVQNLLHGLLLLVATDIRPEEVTPRFAGKSCRMDFLLNEEQIAIEVKLASNKLRQDVIAEQLLNDIAHYPGHKNCKRLIFFIYDPQGTIKNSACLEKDIPERCKALPITVIVSPKFV